MAKTKALEIHLPDWAVKEIEKIVERTSIPFATVVRRIVVEYLREGTMQK